MKVWVLDKMAGLPKEIYVVVAEYDGVNNCPIAFETECLDYESALQFASRIGEKYGRKAIYKAERIKELDNGQDSKNNSN